MEKIKLVRDGKINRIGEEVNENVIPEEQMFASRKSMLWGDVNANENLATD